MRTVTATEKYNAVLEGKMAKKEFVRQMRQEFPMFVSNFDGFDSTVNVLKTRNILFEAAKPKKAFSGLKTYDDRPALTYSLDALDRGIRAELGALGIEMPHEGVTPEDYFKAEKKAKDNLEKDPNHYLNLMSGESTKVDKHDREVEVKRGEGKKDVFNDLKKATLKEGYTEEQIDAAIERIKERKAGEHADGTPKSNDEMEDDEKNDFYDNLDSMEEIDVAGHDIRIKDEKHNIIAVAREIRAKYGDIPGFNGLLKDFLQTHMDDVKSGAVSDPIAEFDNFVDANYDRLNEKDHDGYNTDPNTTMHIDDEEWEQEMGRGVNEYRGSGEDIKSIIRDKAADSGFSEQEEAMEVMEFIGQEYEIDFEFGAGPSRMAEKKGKDHDGDGDIDGDDYMAAKDKAIKKAMGKQEQLKEAIKSIIKKTLNEDMINEAATNELARIADDYAGFEGMKSAILDLQNIVTDIEGYYDKTRDKIQKVYDRLGEIRNEEGLKVGGFLAPAIESAFNKDLRPVTKVGFTKGLDTPKVRTISSAEIDAARAAGEIEEEPKQTMFTPVNENKK